MVLSDRQSRSRQKSERKKAARLAETKKKFSKNLMDAHRTGELQTVFDTMEEKDPSAPNSDAQPQRSMTQVRLNRLQLAAKVFVDICQKRIYRPVIGSFGSSSTVLTGTQ